MLDVSLFESIEYYTIGTSTAVSCRPFRIGDRTINRTTRPATLIVAWLANGYIEYDVYSIFKWK